MRKITLVTFFIVFLFGLSVYAAVPESKMEVIRPGQTTLEDVLGRKPLPVPTNSSKTVLFSESFSGSTFPPTDWDTIQTNIGTQGGYPCYWHRCDTSHYVRTDPASAGLWWSYGHQDEWLITPEIILAGSPTNNYYLRWWYYGFRGSPDNDHYYTKISTDGGTTWTVLYDLSTQVGGGWNTFDEPVELDLSAYANDTITIAWHLDDPPAGTGAIYVWFIDDVEIGYPYANDMGVSNLMEIKTIPVVVNDPDTFRIRVRNFGINAQTDIPVVMSVQGVTVDQVNVSIDTLSFVDTILVWTPTSSGDQTIKFFTQLSGDEDVSNDTLFRDITVCPEAHSVPYFKDFQEDWGPFGNNPPFCGWQIIDNGDEPIPRWNRNDWFHTWLANPPRSVAAVRYSPREHQDEWLISPRIDCSIDSQYTLSYWHQYEGYFGANPDTGYVLLSTDGGNTWTEIVKYAGGVSQVISYGYKTHNISGLVSGQPDVRIAFRYLTYFAAGWLVDDFSVRYTPDIDAMPIAINAPDTILLGDTFDVEIKVFNAGRLELTPPWYVYFQIRDDKDSMLINTAMAPGDTLLKIFQKSIAETDTYTLAAWTVYPGDEYPLNDLLTRRLKVTGWARKENMPTQIPGKGVKDGGALTIFSDTIYAFRGGNSCEFYAYDPANDTWYQRHSVPYVLKSNGTPIKKNVKAGGDLTTFSDKIYAFKGGNTKEFWMYSPGQDTWIQKNSIPNLYFGSLKPTRIKSGGALVAHDTVIYAFKGGNTREFWMYTPFSDTWIPRCSLLTVDGKKVKGGGALVAKGCTIYAFIGGNTNHFYAYLTTDDAWVRMSEPSFDPRPARPSKKKVKDGASLAELDGKIYAFKGGNINHFGYYDIPNDTWYTLEPILGSKRVKAGGSLTAYDGKIYALKGGNTQELWCYTPNAETILPLIANRPVSISTYTSVMTEKTLTTMNPTIDITPNPFAKFATIRYTVPVSGKVSLKLYAASGRLIQTLLDEHRNAGSYTLEIRNLKLGIPRGVHFLKYNANNNSSKIKFIVQ